MSLLLVAVLALAGLTSSAAGADTIRLSPGQAKFWSGPPADQVSTGGTWTYEVEVSGDAYRLRIGLDHPEVGDAFSFRVFGPSGSQAGSVDLGTGLYSGEFMREAPSEGTWRVEVSADGVTDSSFRMRAMLEARPPSLGTKKGPVLPNLQVLPPHEATFLMPITNGSQGDPPRGGPGDSCHPEERVQDRAVRCLRFAFGVRNTGRGPMHLFYEGGPPQPHPLTQRVHLADGSFFDHDAGMAVWHETHAHYHHSEAVAVLLFAVTDPKEGTLESAGPRHSKGFAHRNELLREWHRFYPTWTGDLGFGLLPGWADIYEWDRPGNYVDFGLNGDGLYVVRMWADPVDGILESNDRDNLGYTYFEVAGTDVELIEAGRGKHPWDPCKIVVGFGGHADPKQGPRPDGCPPDTV
jgi:hypothetical protein